jgi:single-strand DNA-binding protein
MGLALVILKGNTTRDVEVRYTPKGTAVAEVGVAVNRRWTTDEGEKKEEVSFFDVTFWGRTAEVANQYVHKGDAVLIEGRLLQQRWDDRETGKGRSKVVVVCNQLHLLGTKPKSEGQAEPREDYNQAHEPAPAKPAGKTEPENPPEDDNIPF